MLSPFLAEFHIPPTLQSEDFPSFGLRLSLGDIQRAVCQQIEHCISLL